MSCLDPSLSSAPVPRPGVLAIDAYVPGKSHAPGVERVFKLSSNETPLGPSPMARAAFLASADQLQDYPDGAAVALRETIGSLHGVDPDQIICGAGSDELLSLVAKAYLSPGDEAVFSQYGFLVYRIATLAAGGVPVVAPETDLTADVDAILAAVTTRTRLVFLANPNNPTGTCLPFEAVRRLHGALPAHVLLVLDSAYAEYVRDPYFDSGLDLARTAPNVLMTRTFSKIYGLAALRVGWAVGSAAVIDALNRVRGPFNVCAPGLAAATAALCDPAHVEEAVKHNEVWRAWLSTRLRDLGLQVTPSSGNFILIHFDPRGVHTARAADAFLTRRGLILRQVGAYGLPDALRMTVGTQEANHLVVEALADFLAGGGR